MMSMRAADVTHGACPAQLMSELVRKAEQNIDALAAKLRAGNHGGAAAAAAHGAAPGGGQPLPMAALSGSCAEEQQRSPSAVAVNDLINAARSSVQQIAGAAPGERPACMSCHDSE